MSVAPALAADAATGTGGPSQTAAVPRLFDPDQPTCRTHDPVTSRDYEGRGHPGRNLQCARVLLILAHQGGHGATCAEVVQALRSDRGNTARRITDLSRLGLIHTTATTRTVGGGRPQHVHFITEEGARLVPVARQLVNGGRS